MHRSHVMVRQPTFPRNECADWAGGGSISHLVTSWKPWRRKAQIRRDDQTRHVWHNAFMAARDYSYGQQGTIQGAERQNLPSATDTSQIDPRAFGLAKVAYSVRETLELLSIGRTSLYAAVKRGELTPVKFGKKTLFYAMDLAAFLRKLRSTAINTASSRRPKV
jgi:excisionase family DNA binding protein